MEVTSKIIQDLTFGYTLMVQERVDCGWQPTLLTFQFNHLNGSPATVDKKMRETVEWVYSEILKRSFRKPRNVPILEMPLWICTPDYPVFKHDKDNFRDIINNGGQHIHVIAVMPPNPRAGAP